MGETNPDNNYKQNNGEWADSEKEKERG